MKHLKFAFFILIITSISSVTSAEGDSAMRIKPLELNEWSPNLLRKLASMASTSTDYENTQFDSAKPATLPRMLATVAHHPALMEPFLGFARAINSQGALTRKDSELLALRAAWNCQSEFEWGHHKVYAFDAGFSEEDIARIAVGPSAGEWPDKERTLLLAADELHAGQNISDEVWATLATEYSDKQLVEILFVVGQYTMLSMVVNAAGVELEPGYDPLPKLIAADK